jgi:SCP-2 sterol transfer family
LVNLARPVVGRPASAANTDPVTAGSVAAAADPASADPISGFFTGLAESGRLATFGDASATLRFDVTSADTVEHWYLTVRKGRVTASRADGPADATVRVSRPQLEGMVTGRVNAQAAMLRGLMTCAGSMAACVMFQRSLPGPPDSTGHVAPIPAAVVMAERRPA